MIKAAIKVGSNSVTKKRTRDSYDTELLENYGMQNLPYLVGMFLVNVTDVVEGVCVDPGEKEAILGAGGQRFLETR
jgi:hypothetical protein